MKVTYTNEQISAINTENKNILVSAAAGSGKTAVLVERIIRKITDLENPVDIDTLLVVTFTEAAAAEMKQRISDALVNKLNSDSIPPDLFEHISKQITLLNKASISTIHSFCLNVVRKNFNQINIDPNFRIADSTELNLIKSEIMESIFEELYTENDEQFIHFINCYSNNKSDEQLKETLLSTYKFIQSMPNPIKWLKEKTEDFNSENIKYNLEKAFRTAIEENKIKLLDIIDILQTCFFIMYNSNTYSEKCENTLNQRKDYLYSFLKVLDSSYEKIKEFVCNAPASSTFKLEENATLSEENLEKIRNINKKITENIRKLREAVSEIVNTIYAVNYSDLYNNLICMCSVIEKFDEKFKSAKREKMILDFNDLEHYCLEILTNSDGTLTAAAKSFQKKFVEIITDEYQDSSLIQELILSSVSKNSIGKYNRFMVGDIKQCIYRFRLANPKIFIEKYNSYSNKPNSNGYRIDLSHNFRSRKCVLDSTNFIFKQIMTAEFGNITYDENAQLNYKADYKIPDMENTINISDNTEVIITDTDSNKYKSAEHSDADEEILEMKNYEIEASVVAAKIKNIMTKEKLNVFDKKEDKYRPVQYKDIVILMRSIKNTAEIFSRILNENGIPTVYEANSGYFNAIEIMTVISYLKIIDNPRQDIPLISVLHSPMYDITSEELSQIRSQKQNSVFYDSLLFYLSDENKEKEDKIYEKVSNFIYDLYKFQKYSKYSTINELLQKIYDETNYYNYVAVMSGGTVRQANLKVLQERSIDFEKTNLKGLFRFVTYINKVSEGTNDFDEAKVLAENENVVRIMTIHKSKGLEFPVVFVSCLNKKFLFKDAKNDFIFDPEFGIGPNFVDFEKRLKFNTIQRHAIVYHDRCESLAEEMRILYVALTRAKEKLILTGNVPNYENFLNKLQKYTNIKNTEIPVHLLLRATSMLEWICAALIRHKDAGALRDNSVLKVKEKSITNDPSSWKITIENINNIIEKNIEEQNKKELLKQNLNNLEVQNEYSNNKDEIYKKLSWEYKNKILNILPSTITISEIKRKREQNELLNNGEYIDGFNNIKFSDFSTNQFEFSELEYPDFTKEDKPLTSAQKGTAFHTVMEHIDFSKNYTVDDIEKFISGLVEKNILSEKEKNALYAEKIFEFLNSDFAARIKKSDKVYKETPFAIGLTPYEIYQKEEYRNINEKIIVHGIIDLYFYENNEIVLLDYKTGNTHNTDISELKKRYKLQLDFYKNALEKNTGTKVSEAVLYFSNNGLFLKL